MDSIVPISVLVGKAVLTPHGLYVNETKADLQDSSQFAAMVMTTQSIIAQALSAVFEEDFGQLCGDGTGNYSIVPGLAPWDQYARSSLKLSSSSDSGEIVVGWCVLLHLMSRLSKSQVIDPKAVLIANFIASQAPWSMHVDREELSAWLTWNEKRNPFASDLERIKHEEIKPVDPFSKQSSISVPWIAQFGQFSAFDAIHDFLGDISISIPHQTASLHVLGGVFVRGHFSHLDVLPKKSPEAEFVFSVEHKGEVMRFRAQSDKHRVVLRLLANAAHRIEQGALQ